MSIAASIIAKYLIIIFMVLYALECIIYFVVKSREKRRSSNIRQIIYIFFIHVLCYGSIYIQQREIKVLILYLAEVSMFTVYMILYHKIHKVYSRFLMNNTVFLLMLGYTMLTRLEFKSALKQFAFSVVGLIVAFFIPYIMTAFKDMRKWDKLYAAIGIIFLLTVFIPGVGMTLNGSSNWIKVAGVSLQPMEFVKILFILFVSSSIMQAERIRDLLINAAITGVFLIILVLQKDFGAVLIFYISYIMMLYLATGRSLFMFAGLGALVFGVLFGYIFLKNNLFAHVMVRYEAWKDPFANRSTGGYQVSESLLSIGTGGFFGTGLGRGKPGLVPVVQSDFIFSAICEELGVIFGLGVIIVYFSSFIAIQNIASKCKDAFFKYLSFGIAICFIFQVLLNIGGVIKFIPSTGITLPLVSSGLSSLYSTLFMLSIIHFNYKIVANQNEKYEIERERAIEEEYEEQFAR